MLTSRLTAAVLLVTLLVAACGQAATPTDRATPTAIMPTDGPTPFAITPTDGPTPSTTADGGATQPPDPLSTPTPAPTSSEIWRTAALRDVRSGETFSIDSLAGKLVVIEPMAIWCSNCRAQQTEARTALERLNRPDLVYISLDIDANEAEPDLARYADERGFPWVFVVASSEVARALAQSFGDQVLSPPSVPIIVINPDGSVENSFGYRSAAELEADLAARLP